MSRKTRVRIAVLAMILFSAVFISFGAWWLTKPSVYDEFIHQYNAAADPTPHIIYEDIPGYTMIGSGILLIVLIPSAVKSANKRADAEEEKAEMREMLREYRQRKNRP